MIPKVNIDSITNPTDYAMPKIHFISHIVKQIWLKSIAIFIVEIAYFSHLFP